MKTSLLQFLLPGLLVLTSCGNGANPFFNKSGKEDLGFSADAQKVEKSSVCLNPSQSTATQVTGDAVNKDQVSVASPASVGPIKEGSLKEFNPECEKK